MSTWNDAPKNTQAILDSLKVAARDMCSSTCAKIADAIGAAEKRTAAPVGLSKALGYVRDHIRRKRASTGLVAQAVNGEIAAPDEDDEAVLSRASVLSAMAYPWE
jgi:hypothetical protein